MCFNLQCATTANTVSVMLGDVGISYGLISIWNFDIKITIDLNVRFFH